MIYNRRMITIHTVVEADRKGDLVRVTEAKVTYVTVGLLDGVPRPLPVRGQGEQQQMQQQQQ